MGSSHTACVATFAAVIGALAGSVTYFGAMFEGASALCFGLDGALLGACSLVLGAGGDPKLRGFIQARAWYAAVHMGIDVMRWCGNSRGTIGNISHLAGFAAGLLYVPLAQPDLGGRPLPKMPCFSRTLRSPFLMREQCFAFLFPHYAMPVWEVQLVVMALLLLLILAALLNTFWRHRFLHASANGYSVFVKAPLGTICEQSW